jgi:hypothetical protein
MPLGGPSQGLVADSRARSPGMVCRGFATRWGPWLREGERARQALGVEGGAGLVIKLGCRAFSGQLN